ncbi:glutathione S-transferase family protein [Acuticoccus sp. M5D2P5]|uniref:glutathione S-transferase family protein n=1 Tax=Acuticoccus kalidii TaxID=2910977 RepID=UPI001F246832|nr:glutathione S-transferase family protein [Acuticoccus kalidii]MCF3931945.1 glutathione S-transferase family protein [Acuticoccus kalidii]
MITVWGRATSSNVQKVMWTIGELGLRYERHDVGGMYGGLDTPQFRALNPHGRIPAVEMDGYAMFESNAIVRHLALADPERRLWPADPAKAGAADMWAEWAHNTVTRPLMLLFWSTVRTRPSERKPAEIARNFEASIEALTAANGFLADRPFIAGDALTIGDVNLAHLLYRYYEMEIDRPSLPALDAYYERLSDRPAYAEHVMVDFETLRAKE